ncbi:MAG: TolC family protein [Candidatus Aminicenantales bacterium]
MKKKTVCAFSAALLALFLVFGCVRYQPKPVLASRTLDDFEARTLDAPEISEFFRARPETEPWPPAVWDLKALTLAALFYHPDMDVARAQWGVAEAGKITAGERPNPTVSVLMGYNVTTPASEASPWIPEAALDIPIETAGKRGYRIDQARHVSEAARLNILSTAWEVRSRLRQTFLDLYAARESETLLALQREILSESLRILEAQLAAGEASPYDVTQARIAFDNAKLAALGASQQTIQAHVRLAGALGVPEKALAGIALSFDGLSEAKAELPDPEMRRRALTTRTDILGGLAEYEAAQSALRLEIAKQYPDIALGPNYQFDQTDSKWTLGLSLILPLLSRNKGPIAEADARRTEVASRFLALQTQVLGDLDAAVAACRSAVEKARAADDILAGLKKQEAAAQARYALGDISKLELFGLRMELASVALARLDALVKAQQAIGDLENILQSPLDMNEWVMDAPGQKRGPVKERKDE